MLRTSATFLAVLMTASVGKDAVPTTTRYPIQEGFTREAIQRLNARTAKLQSGITGFATPGVQSVIMRSRVWSPTEQPLTVAFLGGSPDLRGKIATAITAWSSAANIKFDFGPPGTYREWTRSDTSYAARIRITFDEVGYWSFVGVDSIDPQISKPSQASMNFSGFTGSLPEDWQGTVLHEFGHAIGFEHEHQNPGASCDSEFRWQDDQGYVKTKDMYGAFVEDPQGRKPGIYTVLGGEPNNWTQDQVDFNLKRLPNTTDYRFSALDKHSIMMYSFQGWMFVHGEQSDCYTSENLTLSPQDQRAALETYPIDLNAAVQSALRNFEALRNLASQPRLSPDAKQLSVQRLKELQ